MFPLISAGTLVIISLFVVCFAEDCHPGSVRECLDRFDQIIASCGQDLDCQCDALWTSGVSCFGTCPEDAKAHFIRNFRNNECSDQAWKSLRWSSTRIGTSSHENSNSTTTIPSYIRTNQSEVVSPSTTEASMVPQLPGAKLRRWLNQLSFNRTKADASKIYSSSSYSLSVSPSHQSSVTAMQQPTSSWSIEEETRRKQLQRMKENLQSIRSSRARESSLSRLAAEALTKSIAPTETPAQPKETTSVPEHVQESSASSYFEAHLVAIALFLFCLYIGLPAF